MYIYSSSVQLYGIYTSFAATLHFHSATVLVANIVLFTPTLDSFDSFRF